MDAAKLNAAIEFAKAHETNWPRDFSTQEKIFGSLLGPIPKSRAGHQRRHHPQRLRRRRVRRHQCRRSHLLGRQEHAGDRRRRRRARRPHQESRCAGGIADQGRRLRLAAERQGDLAQPPAAGERVGRRDVGQEARLRRHRRRSATASASRARCRRRARSTNTTTSASIASRCRCCACSRSRSPTSSATR